MILPQEVSSERSARAPRRARAASAGRAGATGPSRCLRARAPKFKQRDAYRETQNTTLTVRVRDDGDEHVEIHDDDEERVPDEERGRKVAGEHVAIKVAEHADVVHREQRLADRAEGLTRAERERERERA